LFAEAIDQRVDAVQRRQTSQDVDDGLGSKPRRRGTAEVLDERTPPDDSQRPAALPFECSGPSRNGSSARVRHSGGVIRSPHG